MASMTVQEYIRKKALGILGLIDTNINPNAREERLTFVNNIQEDMVNKLREYNVWYTGDADELLNYYNRAIAIDYNVDPIFNRNKKSYFWSVSATEGDIKRTHSGQPRNVTDTLVNIVGIPQITVAGPGDTLELCNDRLKKILKDNHFNKMLTQKARPLTLVEGWGAWKINWDKEFSDTPILLYYRAESVDFIYRSGRLVAIVYKDYFQDEKKHDYILFEIRRQDKGNLIIEKELFRMTTQTDIITPVKLTDLKQLKDVKPKIKISNYKGFLGYPSIYFEDNNDDVPGRSIFTGKLDLFDDLDQCLSQSANTVRRSTTVEYFDSLYLEKDDETGLPKMPHAFDRKYVKFKGVKTGDGTAMNSNGPVTATQPKLDFQQYDSEATHILLQIISGIMSPATLGIDIAKKDNAEAQREKEKVTIFTRNTVCDEEAEILTVLANDLLCADELMRTQKISCHEYSVSVKYDEFADASFEKKLETVLGGWREGLISDKLAVEYIYGTNLSDEDKKSEIKFIEEQRKASQGLSNLGEFGEEGAENPYNEENAVLETPDIPM